MTESVSVSVKLLSVSSSATGFNCSLRSTTPTTATGMDDAKEAEAEEEVSSLAAEVRAMVAAEKKKNFIMPVLLELDTS